MCSTWGAIPSTPFASSARRCSTPKRCCSSTTQTPRRAKRTVGSISAWVPTTSPARRWRAAPAPPCAARGRRPGQQRERRRVFGEQLAQGHRVLLGQRLGRRHQHRLEPGFERPQHRVQRHHRLPRPHLPHQQPLHRLARVEIGIDLVERLQLILRSARTAATRSSAHQLTGLPQLRRRPGGAMRPLPRRQERLVQEQLFERQPLARRLDVVLRSQGSEQP